MAERMDTTRMTPRPDCPICGGGSAIIDTVATINPRSEDRLSLRACAACRHWWVDPMPTQDYLMDLYAGHSAFVVPEQYQGSAPAPADPDRIAAYLGFDPRQRTFSYLEIGIGTGDLYRYLEPLASVSYGVEPGGWKYGGRNVVPDIEHVPGDMRFDLIVIQDVLEHLTDPVAMLARLRGLAAPEGRLVCGYPNKDALVAQVFRRRWPMVRPLGHLHFFSRRSTQAMMQRTGWGITTHKSCRPDRQTWWEMIRADFTAGGRIKALAKIPIRGSRDQWLLRCRPIAQPA